MEVKKQLFSIKKKKNLDTFEPKHIREQLKPWPLWFHVQEQFNKQVASGGLPRNKLWLRCPSNWDQPEYIYYYYLNFYQIIYIYREE